MPSGGSFGGGGSAGLKTAATGNYFLIPAGPAVGTTIYTAPYAPNAYGGWIQMVAATSAAVYVVGASVSVADINNDPTYVQLDIGTGASPVSIGECKAAGNAYTADIVAPAQFTFMFPIPVPIATQISCRVASNINFAIGVECLVTLVCINQADVVAI